MNQLDKKQTLKYFCDNSRHLICLPYSIENLHKMAEDLGIKKCWYDSRPFGHYDIPKKRIEEIKTKCEIVPMKRIWEIGQGIITV